MAGGFKTVQIVKNFGPTGQILKLGDGFLIERGHGCSYHFKLEIQNEGGTRHVIYESENYSNDNHENYKNWDIGTQNIPLPQDLDYAKPVWIIVTAPEYQKDHSYFCPNGVGMCEVSNKMPD